MSEQKNLFELLKPEAKRNLVRNIVEYPITANGLIKKLKSLYFKSDLTVENVSDLYSFTNVDFPENSVSALWCIDLFDKYEN